MPERWSADAIWDTWRPGQPLHLRAVSSLHREVYPVEVLERESERLRLSYPMKHGRLVLLPVGSPILLAETADGEPQVQTKLVRRLPGRDRALLVARPSPRTPLVSRLPRKMRGRVIAVVGSMPGVGTSTVAVNLAVAMAASGRVVCFISPEEEVGRPTLLKDVEARWGLDDVSRGVCSAFEAAERGPRGLLVLRGGSGGGPIPEQETAGGRWLGATVKQIAAYVDVLVMDAGVAQDEGIRAVVAEMADERVLVTTPDPHGVTESYALIHDMEQASGGRCYFLVVNGAVTEREGEATADKMSFAAARFLGTRLALGCVIPKDRGVQRAVRRGRLLMDAAPRTEATKAIRHLAFRLVGLKGADEGFRRTGGRSWSRWLGRSRSVT